MKVKTAVKVLAGLVWNGSQFISQVGALYIKCVLDVNLSRVANIPTTCTAIAFTPFG